MRRSLGAVATSTFTSTTTTIGVVGLEISQLLLQLFVLLLGQSDPLIVVDGAFTASGFKYA